MISHEDEHRIYCRAWRAEGDQAVYCGLTLDHDERHDYVRGGATVAEAQACDEAALAGFNLVGRIDVPQSAVDTPHLATYVGTFDGEALIAQAEALEERVALCTLAHPDPTGRATMLVCGLALGHAGDHVYTRTLAEASAESEARIRAEDGLGEAPLTMPNNWVDCAHRAAGLAARAQALIALHQHYRGQPSVRSSLTVRRVEEYIDIVAEMLIDDIDADPQDI